MGNKPTHTRYVDAVLDMVAETVISNQSDCLAGAANNVLIDIASARRVVMRNVNIDQVAIASVNCVHNANVQSTSLFSDIQGNLQDMVQLANSTGGPPECRENVFGACDNGATEGGAAQGAMIGAMAGYAIPGAGTLAGAALGAGAGALAGAIMGNVPDTTENIELSTVIAESVTQNALQECLAESVNTYSVTAGDVAGTVNIQNLDITQLAKAHLRRCLNTTRFQVGGIPLRSFLNGVLPLFNVVVPGDTAKSYDCELAQMWIDVAKLIAAVGLAVLVVLVLLIVRKKRQYAKRVRRRAARIRTAPRPPGAVAAAV